MTSRAPVSEIRRRHRHPSSRKRREDAHQSVGLRVRQRLEQHAVHDAEDRGVRADAECQRQHRHGGERRRPPEHAQRIRDILAEIREELHASNVTRVVGVDVAAIVLRVLEISEPPARLVQRRFGRGSLGHELLCPHVQMKAQLFLDVVVDLPRGTPGKTK